MADGITVIDRPGSTGPTLTCNGNDSPTWALSLHEGSPPARMWRPRRPDTIIDDGLLLWFIAVIREPSVCTAATRCGFPADLPELRLEDVDQHAYDAVLTACRAATHAGGACLTFDRRGWGASSVRSVELFSAPITVLEVVFTREANPWGPTTYTAPGWGAPSTTTASGSAALGELKGGLVAPEKHCRDGELGGRIPPELGAVLGEIDVHGDTLRVHACDVCGVHWLVTDRPDEGREGTIYWLRVDDSALTGALREGRLDGVADALAGLLTIDSDGSEPRRGIPPR